MSGSEPSAEVILLRSQMAELIKENKGLREQLKTRFSSPSSAPFPSLVVNLLNKYLPGKFLWITKLYVRYISLLNYAVVGFVGYLINTGVLYVMVTTFPLWMANAIAVCVAFLSNWTFSVGPLGYLMGLRSNMKEVKN